MRSSHDAGRARRRPATALPGRVAVVMTMGALHEGHAALLRAARSAADSVVVTIFVNPLQFGAGEDLDRYPRTLEADLAVCEREGVDARLHADARRRLPRRPAAGPGQRRPARRRARGRQPARATSTACSPSCSSCST